MFKFSKSTEYSILALIYISNNESKSVINSRTISEQLNIPYELLSKLLQKLVKGGIVKSTQGKYGGYNLLIPAKQLSVLSIINALDENIQVANCTFDSATKDDCGRINDCIIRTPFISLQDKINNIFESLTIEQLSK
jgi:Rrf2 family protein